MRSYLRIARRLAYRMHKGTIAKGQAVSIVVTTYPKSEIADLIKKVAKLGDIRYVRAEREGDRYKLTGANSLKAPPELAALVSRRTVIYP